MMIIRQNRYTVQAEYAAQNKEHVSRIMEELRALRRTDIESNIFVEDDGKTFIHLLFCANEEAEQVFFMLESVKAWISALAGSHPEVPPTMSTLTAIGI